MVPSALAQWIDNDESDDTGAISAWGAFDLDKVLLQSSDDSATASAPRAAVRDTSKRKSKKPLRVDDSSGAVARERQTRHVRQPHVLLHEQFALQQPATETPEALSSDTSSSGAFSVRGCALPTPGSTTLRHRAAPRLSSDAHRRQLQNELRRLLPPPTCKIVGLIDDNDDDSASEKQWRVPRDDCDVVDAAAGTKSHRHASAHRHHRINESDAMRLVFPALAASQSLDSLLSTYAYEAKALEQQRLRAALPVPFGDRAIGHVHRALQAAPADIDNSDNDSTLDRLPALSDTSVHVELLGQTNSSSSAATSTGPHVATMRRQHQHHSTRRSTHDRRSRTTSPQRALQHQQQSSVYVRDLLALAQHVP